MAHTDVLLFDGAMGTMLYQKGVFINRCYDELNLREPALVQEIHRAYVQAGAGIVADSVPGNEWQETLNKARGLLKAIEAAQRQ